MRNKKTNTSFIFNQPFVLLIMALLILVTPCSVKSQIKSIAGLPTQTENNAVNKTNSKSSLTSSDTCVITNDSEVHASSNVLSQKTSDVLPVFLFALSVVCFFTLRIHQNKTSSTYEKLRIIPTLPLFMQYRQLII